METPLLITPGRRTLGGFFIRMSNPKSLVSRISLEESEDKNHEVTLENLDMNLEEVPPSEETREDIASTLKPANLTFNLGAGITINLKESQEHGLSGEETDVSDFTPTPKPIVRKSPTRLSVRQKKAKVEERIRAQREAKNVKDLSKAKSSHQKL